jgi:hypothetical protein
MARKTRNRVAIKRLPSNGIRYKLGRPVRDAVEGEELSLPLVKLDIETARHTRRNYDVDGDANFTTCVIANCLGRAINAEALIMRRHAYVARDGEDTTLRYVVDRASTRYITLNDEDRFDEIPPNVTIKLVPPKGRQRLVSLRNRVRDRPSEFGRHDLNKPGGLDPMRGVWRNGGAAPDHEL